jgi:hypothetical protein
MTLMEIVLILFGIAIVAALAVAVAYYLRRAALRRQFGPEYDRLVSEKDTYGEAEHELRERSERFAQLQLRDLSAESRSRYARDWQRLQIRFIDSPDQAVGEADQLLTRLLTELGYPARDFDEQAAMLSVEHARTLSDYRTAHDIAERHARGEADTEELRQAIVHFRAIAADLLGQDPTGPGSPSASGSEPGARTASYPDPSASAAEPMPGRSRHAR